MAPKGTFTVVCYAKDGMGASSVALSRDTFTAVCYARVHLHQCVMQGYLYISLLLGVYY